VTARQPLEAFNAKYRAALEKYRSESQSGANLTAALAANKAIDVLDKGESVGGSEDPTVASLEKTYLAHQPAVAGVAMQALLKVDQDYVQSLKKIILRLTKAGQIDQALQVQAQVVKVEEQIKSARSLKSDDMKQAPAVSPSAQGVTILSATYGSGGKNADVTEAVKRFVEVEKRMFSVSPGDLGSDPSPGWNKGLTIKYTKNGVAREQHRGEREVILVESFYGPQDVAELESWLPGTAWTQGAQRYEFREDKTFIGGRATTANHWKAGANPYEIILTWSDGKTSQCALDFRWNSFEEKTGEKRVFKKLK
jgi:hypothetical protein